MKKLSIYLIIILIFSSCNNPLNKVYKPISYEDDLKKIERYDRFAAKKIEFVPFAVPFVKPDYSYINSEKLNYKLKNKR